MSDQQFIGVDVGTPSGDRTIIHTGDAQFICTVKAGSRITSYKGLVVVIHPDDPPKYIDLAECCLKDFPLSDAKDVMVEMESYWTP